MAPQLTHRNAGVLGASSGLTQPSILLLSPPQHPHPTHAAPGAVTLLLVLKHTGTFVSSIPSLVCIGLTLPSLQSQLKRQCLVVPARIPSPLYRLLPPDFQCPSPHLALGWWWFSHQVVSNSCNPMDCTPPDSSVHGILQARILEWVAF